MSDISEFRNEVAARVHAHRIVRENAYTQWFARGEATIGELRAFTVQFSVFSHLFIEAQLRKCLNAPTLPAYRAGKEILMNELGVVFTRSGSIDGGRFTFGAAHFEWLLAFGEALGLQFADLGKRALGSASTLHFCDALMRWYASSNASESAGASYAVEHWAAAGFWKELILGLRRIKSARSPHLPLGFWTWHDRIEDQHAAHTDDELAMAFAQADFDETAFLRGAQAVLDAVAVFWDGLWAELRRSQSSPAA